MKRFAVLILLGFGCSSSSVTAVQVDVQYETSWGLDHLSVTVRDKRATTDMAPSVRLLLPDDWAGQPQTVEVFGLKGSEKWAHGNQNVTPVRGQETHVVVMLGRLPCGAWCNAGATTCMGAATASCVTRADGCLAWGTPTQCPSSAPQCSQGFCSAQCVAECAAGETRCDGPSAVRNCAEGNDGDACLEWLPSAPCPMGQICSNGRCAIQCRNECQAGDVRCFGNGRITCGDLNADGCLEWSPVMPCGAGNTCSNGQCSSQCQDECTASACSGRSYAACGQYDFDSCMDLSPGVSCIPVDLCHEGMCTTQGCIIAADVCQVPPAPTCVNATKLRTYGRAGTCTSGTCDYPYTETICQLGCSMDQCMQRTWTLEIVDSTGNVGRAPSLRASGAALHISYLDATDQKLKYAYRASSSDSWHTEIVDPANADASSSYTSLALDGSQGVHIIYRTASGGLKHAYKPSISSAWSFDDIDSNGTHPSIEIGASGELQVAYGSFTGTSATVKYAHRSLSGSAWSIESIEIETLTGGKTPGRPSLELLGSGAAIAYSLGSPDLDLRYATHAAPGSTWTTEIVDGPGDVGLSPTLRIDSSGGRHIVYYDSSNGDLKYAFRGASEAMWHFEMADGAGTDVGRYTGMEIDGAGTVHVSYYDDTNDDLKYAFRPLGGGWTVQSLDTQGAIGYYGTSLAIDGAGGLHISYYDQTNGDLKHAYLAP